MGGVGNARRQATGGKMRSKLLLPVCVCVCECFSCEKDGGNTRYTQQRPTAHNIPAAAATRKNKDKHARVNQPCYLHTSHQTKRTCTRLRTHTHAYAHAHRLFYRDLSNFDGHDVSGTMGKTVKLVDNFDSLYQYVTNEGRTFWFRSNTDAPKYKVPGYGTGGPL